MGVFTGEGGDVSSKRVIGATIILWVMICSTWYFHKVQNGGDESPSTENILMTALVSACVMITGGVIEKFSKGNKDK